MNKDNSLKIDENNLVLLVVGNDDNGNKSIVTNWMKKFTPEFEETRSFYKIFYFAYEDTFQGDVINIRVEVRVINGEEFDSDLKHISPFFKGAMGAFVVTSIDEFVSFQDGIKWKEKVDLMSCLPNKFPLPINLIINKCELKEKAEKRPWLDKETIESYVRDNQFIKHFLVSSKKDSRESGSFRDSFNTIESVEMESPLKDLIKTIFMFKDIKEKFLNNSIKLNTSKINNKLNNSSYSSNKSLNESKNSKKDKKSCSIL